MRSGIAILDFGGQYAHLICNRIRRLSVFAEVFTPTVDPAELSGARGIVFSGGPASVYDENPPEYAPEHLETGLPVLGLCYGHQLICRHLGGEVSPGSVREYGSALVRLQGGSPLFEGLAPSEVVWMSHGDTVARLPEGFRIIGETDDCPAAAVEDPDRRIYGLQFHPEVAHTPRGMDILDNFLRICEAPRTWTMAGYADTAISEIRAQAGDRNIFLLVSGGVDSSVAFVLFNRALGPARVQGLHIDTGFMRKGETEEVDEFLTREGFENLEIVDASEDFLGGVEGMTDPEEKRQAIGGT
ncbi:MAG: glutamine-hydrolyzing GMP synthase, partial [Candidatus Latescibacteria bacterium]|nr:glutamine-hydrolyzing GMP synthase [Candidatus Latescibacterota bacterium]